MRKDALTKWNWCREFCLVSALQGLALLLCCYTHHTDCAGSLFPFPLIFFNIASLCGYHFSLAVHAPPTLYTGCLEHFVFIIHLFIYLANLLIFSALCLVTILFWLCPCSPCIVHTMSVDFFSLPLLILWQYCSVW